MCAFNLRFILVSSSASLHAQSFEALLSFFIPSSFPPLRLSSLLLFSRETLFPLRHSFLPIHLFLPSRFSIPSLSSWRILHFTHIHIHTHTPLSLSLFLSLSLSTRFPFSIPPRSRSFHSFFSAFLTFRPSIPLSSSVSPCSNMAGRCPITRSSLPATVFPRAPLHDAKATKKRSSSSAATFLPPIFPLFPPRRGHQPLPLPSPRRFPSSHNVHAVPFSARTSHSTRGGIDPACDLNWETVPLLRDPSSTTTPVSRERERESD